MRWLPNWPCFEDRNARVWDPPPRAVLEDRYPIHFRTYDRPRRHRTGVERWRQAQIPAWMDNAYDNRALGYTYYPGHNMWPAEGIGLGNRRFRY
jgi:hypothetical protein